MPNFARLHNRVMMGSKEPDRPFNVAVARRVKVNFAYPFYLLPILLPRVRPLGIAPVTLGISQVLVHCVVYPAGTRTAYVSGAATAVLLHLPIGVAWLKEANRERPFTKTEIAAGLGAGVAFAVFGLARPNLRLKADYAATHAR